MNKYPDFHKFIFGDVALGITIGSLVIAYICALVSMLIEASNRDITSSNTPIKFSWKFFTFANLARIIANVLLIPIFVRVAIQYFSPDWLLIASVGIGAGVDRLAMVFKKWGVLATDKLAAKVADKLAPEQPTVIPPVKP